MKKHQRRKIFDRNLMVSVVSGAAAVTLPLGGVMGLSLPFSQEVSWGLFGALFVITAVFFYWHRNKPEMRTIGNKTRQYLAIAKAVEPINKVNVTKGIYTLSLTTSKQKSGSGESLIDQAIRWKLMCNNADSNPITSFTMVLSLSEYTSWKDGSIKFYARVGKEQKHMVMKKINEFKLVEPKGKGRRDIRFLTCEFPEGFQCIYAEPFVFELEMKWTRGAHFLNLDRYFSNPANYGERVDQLTIEVSSDSPDILDRNFQLYRVDKDYPMLIPHKAVPDRSEYHRVRWTIHPSMDELYVVELEK